jgi:hypothetical protein
MINLVIASKRYSKTDSRFNTFMADVTKCITESPYYHTEVIFDGLWYSMNTDGMSAGALRPLEDNWDYQLVEVDDKFEDIIRQWFEWTTDKEYDWMGAVRAQYSWFPESKDKYFCTEFVGDLLQACDVRSICTIDTSKLTPGELYELLDK